MTRVFLILSVLFLSACSRSVVSDDILNAPGDRSVIVADVASQKKRVTNQTIDLELRVSSSETENASRKIKYIAGDFGGYISTASADYLNVIIPTDSVEPFLEKIGDDVAKVRNLKKSFRDVTTDYDDAAARLKLLRERRDRYNRMLADPINTVDENLKIEKELADVQSQIFALEKQIAGIADNVKYTKIFIRYDTMPVWARFLMAPGVSVLIVVGIIAAAV